MTSFRPIGADFSWTASDESTEFVESPIVPVSKAEKLAALVKKVKEEAAEEVEPCAPSAVQGGPSFYEALTVEERILTPLMVLEGEPVVGGAFYNILKVTERQLSPLTEEDQETKKMPLEEADKKA